MLDEIASLYHCKSLVKRAVPVTDRKDSDHMPTCSRFFTVDARRFLSKHLINWHIGSFYMVDRNMPL